MSTTAPEPDASERDASVPDAFETALESVDVATAAALRELVRDRSYVEPRVVSHLRD